MSISRIWFTHQALTQNRKAQCQIRKSSPKSLTTNRIRPLKFLRAAGYDLGCVLRPPLRCRMMHLRLHSQFSQNEKSWWNKMLLAWSWASPGASFPGHLVTWSLIVSVYSTKTTQRLLHVPYNCLQRLISVLLFHLVAAIPLWHMFAICQFLAQSATQCQSQCAYRRFFLLYCKFDRVFEIIVKATQQRLYHRSSIPFICC